MLKIKKEILSKNIKDGHCRKAFIAGMLRGSGKLYTKDDELGLEFTVPDEETAAQVASSYAPEHLEIQTENPERVARMITAAGAIFLGEWTPESCGDFCAGPSHVLPTAGSAKKFNGLETASFYRRTSLVKYSQQALKRDADVIARFGAMEQLDAHGRAGTIRGEK